MRFVIEKSNLKDSQVSEDRVYGITKDFEEKIIVESSLSDGLMADTLMHEALHACWIAASLPTSGNSEEDVCSRLSGYLVQVLRDNPSFTSFIINGNKE